MGSDDFRVCFYDFSRTSKPLVAKLQVHLPLRLEGVAGMG